MEKFQLTDASCSHIRMRDVLFDNHAKEELNLFDDIIPINEMTDISDNDIKLGHEFMIANSDKVIITYCEHHYRSAGPIKTINVAKLLKLNWSDPIHAIKFVPLQKHHTDGLEFIEWILSGIKYLYQDRVLILNKATAI